MALNGRSAVVDTTDTRNITSEEKESQYGVLGYDPEKAEDKTRKMSRVGGPIPGIAGDSDVDSQISVGKQLELEQTNSIKYRTCSWQKVVPAFSSPSRA